MKSSGFFFFLQYKYVVLPTLKKKKNPEQPRTCERVPWSDGAAGAARSCGRMLLLLLVTDGYCWNYCSSYHSLGAAESPCGMAQSEDAGKLGMPKFWGVWCSLSSVTTHGLREELLRAHDTKYQHWESLAETAAGFLLSHYPCCPDPVCPRDFPLLTPGRAFSFPVPPLLKKGSFCWLSALI